MAAKKSAGKAPPSDGLKILAPEKVALADLNFAAYNPRSMPAKEREALEAGIEEHGVITSLVVQKKGSTVIGGHQRIRAIRAVCKRRKWDMPAEVWAYVLDVDDRRAKRINIALNNVHGEFDPHMLGEVLRSINDEAPLAEREVLALAFDMKQLDGLLKVGQVPDLSVSGMGPGVQNRSVTTTPTLSIEFASEPERDAARDRLADLIRARKDMKAGTIVLAALGTYRPGP